MRWETRAQGVKKDRAGLAQPVAVCEMSVQHLRGAGTVCKMTMQHLHGLFTVCKMTVQHLHSPFTVCEMTMQHLHGPFTVCGETMQHLHSPFTVCETIMQPLHSLVAVCAPLHVPGKIRWRPQTPRPIIRPRMGPSGGRMRYAPTPGYQVNFAAPVGAVPPDHSAPSGTVWGRMQFAPTCTRQIWQASLMPRQTSLPPQGPSADAHP